jgi:hypothetical protein
VLGGHSSPAPIAPRLAAIKSGGPTGYAEDGSSQAAFGRPVGIPSPAYTP